MRVGIIAEGWADVAVILQVLKGQLGLDESETVFLRPELSSDETDRGDPGARTFSNWEIVKNELCDATTLRDFLESDLDEEMLVVVHLDTAECELPNYGVERPPRDSSAYVFELVYAVLAKVSEWLGDYRHPGLRFAIAVEETDAWVLTLYSMNETHSHLDPKAKLTKELNRPNAFSEKERRAIFSQKNERLKYRELAKGFRKQKALLDAAKRNASLAIFLTCLGERSESQ
jgi:hypothetical protein